MVAAIKPAMELIKKEKLSMSSYVRIAISSISVFLLGYVLFSAMGNYNVLKLQKETYEKMYIDCTQLLQIPTKLTATEATVTEQKNIESLAL